MNKGFTKLEIILVGIILLFAISYFGTKNLSSFVGKEGLLKQRYYKYGSLLNDKKYSEVYKFFSSSVKIKTSLEDFIKENESSNMGKQEVTINKIVIKDNVGYIDRNNIVCLDNNCNTKTELRGYKRWVFENGNWYYSPPDPRCIREEMYNMPAEFKRALSLIEQRLVNRMGNKAGDFSFFNCLDIQYSNLEDKEGVFTFVPGQSSIDKLSILVNHLYVSSDDLLTAFLLSHEAMHASNYLDQMSNGIKIACVEDEVKGFTIQLLLSSSLTEEEMRTVNLKLREGYGSINNQLKILRDLLTYRDYARRMCNSLDYNDCFFKYFNKSVEDMVRSNPYYQKQCGLN